MSEASRVVSINGEPFPSEPDPPAPPRPLEFVRLAEWQGRELPNREYIVDGLIEIGTATLIAGPSDIGKSMFCQQLMSACALGKPWMGYSVMGCATFGMFSEDYQDEVVRRQVRINDHYDVEMSDLEDRVTFKYKNGDDPVIYRAKNQWASVGDKTDMWESIVAHIKKFNVRLLILDHMKILADINDKNSRQLINFIRFLDAESFRLQIGTVVLSHPPKDQSSYFSGLQEIENTFRCSASFQRPKTYDPARPREGADERELIVKNANGLAWDHPLKQDGIPIIWNNGVLVRRKVASWSLTKIQEVELDMRVWRAIHDHVKARRRPIARDERSRNSVLALMSLPRNRYSWREALPHVPASIDRLLMAGRLEMVLVGRETETKIRPTGLNYTGERPVLAEAAE